MTFQGRGKYWGFLLPQLVVWFHHVRFWLWHTILAGSSLRRNFPKSIFSNQNLVVANQTTSMPSWNPQ